MDHRRLLGTQLLTQTFRAIIKTAMPGSAVAAEVSKREYEIHCMPTVRSSPYFRAFYEVVDEPDDDGSEPAAPFLALEWMDTTLRDFQYDPHTYSYKFIFKVIEAILSSSEVLIRDGLVNTGTSPLRRLMRDEAD